MTNRDRALLLIAGLIVLLLFLGLILYPLFTPETEEEPAAETPTPVTSPSELTPLPVTPSVNGEEVFIDDNGEPIPQTEAAERAEVERVSRLFVERFGSFSNFSNFENVTSIESFMTESMSDFAMASVREETANNFTDDYYGVTTRVISLKIGEFNSQQSATVNIVVKVETQDGLNAEIQESFKDGRVELVYQDGSWLVDGLYYN